MEKKQRKNIIFVLLCITVIVEAIILVGFFVSDIGSSEPSIQETDYIWVDFDVTGTIRVEVEDTNCGEVPDEAWEEARRLMGEFGNYASVKFKIKGYGTYGEVIVP